MGTLYSHWSEVPWDNERWPNFRPYEPNLACPCCGEFYLDYSMMDSLQALRVLMHAPLRINSGHRCIEHNIKVGGAPYSQHKAVAWDISVIGHDRFLLKKNAKLVGFTGFGHYATFLHVDKGRPRYWYSAGGKKKWNG